MFIDTNKIATVFGRKNLDDYIKKEIANGNLVRIKKKSNQISELTSPINASYEETTPKKNIPQTDTESQDITTNSDVVFSQKDRYEAKQENGIKIPDINAHEGYMADIQNTTSSYIRFIMQINNTVNQRFLSTNKFTS